MGFPPISTIGLGFTVVSSDSREPNPPANMTAFMVALSKPQMRVRVRKNHPIGPCAIIAP
jgi:hypothetical protein